MTFKIEISPRNDPTGATKYAVVVTIDDHETILSFESKETAERFADFEEEVVACCDGSEVHRRPVG